MTSEFNMTDTFDEMLARVDRTNPSLNEVLPALVLLFKMHESRIHNLDKRADGHEQRIENAREYLRENIAAIPDFIDERLHRVHLGINHAEDRATEAISGAKRMHERVDFLEDRMTGMEGQLSHPRQTTVNLATDLESLTAYVHRLETLLNDIEGKFAAWVKTLEEDADIERKRIDALERAALSKTENDRPQRDTDWRPYTGKTNEDCPVHVDDYVEVLTRDNHHNYGRAIRFDWSDNMHGGTIVAWRYATEVM